MKKLTLSLFLGLAVFVLPAEAQKLHATPQAEVKDTLGLVKAVMGDLPEVGKTNQGRCPGTCSTEDNISEIAKKISEELTLQRKLSPFMKKCLKSIPGQKLPQTFEDAIRISVEQNFAAQENMLPKDILQQYDVETKEDLTNVSKVKWNENVGLFTHPMCETTDYYFISRKENSKKSRIKNSEKKLKEFIQGYNKLFYAMKKAVAEKKSEDELSVIKREMKEFYFALMASMAVHESLGDANNSQQNKLAKEFSKAYGARNYIRPPGVKFYFDDSQDEEISKQNIGLYQFTPKIGGNIDPCYHAWNNIMAKKSPACKIYLDSDDEISFDFVAASDQVFNAFCGANKLVQSYGIQINSRNLNKPKAKSMQLSHADNKAKKGLKASQDRCVSPFAHASNAYMHFGVMGFTVFTIDSKGKDSSNTQGVITQTLDALKED
jgi:hypothetical protein